ncbi:MAG: nucleotidyltransferase domain-containing protein [Desulfotomaculum sp.]|nr:nucleotidyltransferase domain-containing protein [Desulfotomaculum sp.]
MVKTKYFSTHLLDKALAKNKAVREHKRQQQLALVFEAIDKLSSRVSFEKSYVFGSLVKPDCFLKNSDIDIAFEGLSNREFFPTITFLASELDAEIDVIQMEGHPLRDIIVQEGIEWKQKS